MSKKEDPWYLRGRNNPLRIARDTKRNVDAVGRKDGETRVKNGKKQRWNGKAGRWISVSNQQPTKTTTTSGLSKAAQSNLQAKANIARAERKKYSGMTQKEINALKQQKGEGIAGKRTMSTWREDSKENRRLQLQAKTGSNETYKRNSSSGSSKSEAKDTGGTSDSDKAAWLRKTRNSPAAKSGAFKPEERWKIQKGVRERKAAKLKIKQDKNKKNGG